MKFLTKKMLAVMALLSVTGYSFGYQYGISVISETPMIVRVIERQIGTVDQYAVVLPQEKKAFNFEGAMCLKAIEAAPFNPDKRWEGNGNPKYDSFKGKNLLEIQKMGIFGANYNVDAHFVFHELVRTVALINVDMKMLDNEVFKDTAKAATLLVKGLDELACKVTDIAMAAATGGGTEISKNIAGAVNDASKGDLLGLGKTKADAIDKIKEAQKDPNKKPEADKAIDEAKVAQKIVDIARVSSELIGLIDYDFDRDPIGYTIKPVPGAIKALEAKKALFDDATYTKIKGLLDKGSNGEAMTAIEEYKESLKPKVTQTKIDTAAVIYKCNSGCSSCDHGCSSCDINTHLNIGGAKDTKATDTKKPDLNKTCSFGLGAIAKASAALTEQSLCQNRDFILIRTGEKAQTVIGTRKITLPFDEYIATTKKGG